MIDQTANFITQDLTSSVASGDTTLNVNDASAFPDPSTQPFRVVIFDADAYAIPANDPDVEILRVTGRSTNNDTLTVSRGKENTTAASHPSTTRIILPATAGLFEQIDSSLESLNTDKLESSNYTPVSDIANQAIDPSKVTIGTSVTLTESSDGRLEVNIQ